MLEAVVKSPIAAIRCLTKMLIVVADRRKKQ